MKIVLPLFSHLTGKKIFASVHKSNIFPPGRDLFWWAVRGWGEILQEANIQNGRHKLEEKWLGFVVFEHIRS